MQFRRALYPIESSADFVDPRFEFFEMRAGPVDPSAFSTAAKIFVMKAGERFESILNFVFFNVSQRSIATHASCEGYDCARKIKPLDDFQRLFLVQV